MNRASHDFFARTAFAADQHGYVRGRDALDKAKNVLHAFRYSYHTMKAIAETLLVLVHSLVKIMDMKGALDHDFKFFESNRLGIIIECAKPHRAQRILIIV